MPVAAGSESRRPVTRGAKRVVEGQRIIGSMYEKGMRYRWQVHDAGRSEGQTLTRQLGVHPLVGLLLHHRGFDDPDQASRFLHPKLTDLHDPAGLPGIEAAAGRLDQAVSQRQRIVIYGDYDVDGITASAILWHVLTAAGADVRCYIPHRIEEGYGLSVQAIQQIAQGQGADPDRACDGSTASTDPSSKPLIVSVDCGITAVEPAAAAREAGVDLIITDHHEFPAGKLPDASVLVHPRLNGSKYPFGYLCGAGVAFKLAWQFAKVRCGCERVSQDFRELLLDLLSLAALGTVADVVPLIDENRIITTFGLGQIKRTRFTGLNALIDASRLREEKIDAFHVGFVLGPRLNACGRMGHAKDAVHLLTDAGESEATRIARYLTDENNRRRAIERQIVDEADQMVRQAGYDRDDCRAIVLSREGWHLGVVGIVASRLVDTFARPVVLLSVDNGQAHGSARSVEGVAIHEAIGSCAELLNSFGGHAMAAGLRLDADKVDQFRHRFTQYVNALLSADDLVHTIQVHSPCQVAQMTLPVAEQIQTLAPFGRSNPGPLFCLRGVRLDGPAHRVGAGGQHLRVQLREGNRTTSAVGFGMGDMAEGLTSGALLDVVFGPKLSTWQGRRRVEIHIRDLKYASSGRMTNVQ